MELMTFLLMSNNDDDRNKKWGFSGSNQQNKQLSINTT